MRWHPENQERTFLRFVRRLSEHMGIPAREICIPMAWYFWKRKKWSAHTAFRFLAS